jgi:hypothetical protein
MILKLVVAHSVSTPTNVLGELFAKWSEAERSKFDESCRQGAEANVEVLHKLGLWKQVSPKERDFLTSYGSRMDQYAQKAAGWRMECAGMIMWALQLIDQWPKIDEEMPVGLLKDVPVHRVGWFTKHPPLRPSDEVSTKRNLIELWHWRVRTRQLIEMGHPFEPDENMRKAGLNTFDDIVRFSAKSAHADGILPEVLDEDFVFLGKPFRGLSEEEYQVATSIIMERHYGLNWLCGAAPRNRWDETPTDT